MGRQRSAWSWALLDQRPASASSRASASWASCGHRRLGTARGRRYIERGLSRMGELRAIVAICERVVEPASEETR
jgi:hypothetical protein